MSEGLELAIPGGWPVLGLLALGLAAAAIYGARRLTGLSPLRRRVLIGARALTAIAVLAVAAQPRWVEERFEESRGRLAVLFDVSRSMGIPRGDAARAQRASALAARWADDAAEPVAAFTFGERLEAIELSELGTEARAHADASRLAPALTGLLDQEVGRDLGAVVVVADGAGAGSEVDAEAFARRGVRLYAVAVGEDDLRDDAIVDVSADAVGFLRRPARVRVTVRSSGGPGGPIPVTLRRGDGIEREVVVEVPADGEAEVDIPFTPPRLGREIYRLSIPRAPDDAVPENDERAFLVRVVRDKLRVLLVAGQPSWDQRFMRSFLKRDPATDLISFFILRSTSDLTMASPEELALIPFPTDELFNEHLGSFDVVIFQNFEFGPYQMAGYLPRIRDYVLRGGSFAMIGGPLSFSSGGYAGTPITEVLPVELLPNETPETRSVVTDRFQPQIRAGLERHPLLELVPGPSANAAAWSRLAPLVGANVVRRPRPDATVLLEHPRQRVPGGGPLPVLVLGEAGAGRTLAFTTDTSWRWGITTGGATGDASAYERFWDTTMRWLARDPALEPAQVSTDRERYGPGARVEVRAWLRDARYAPLAGRDIELTILGASGVERGRARARTDAEGRASASMRAPDAPGAYRVTARAVDPTESEPGESLAEEVFLVEAGGDELADPIARPERLRALAEASGGAFFARPEDAPSLDTLDTSRVRSLGSVERAPLGGPLAFLFLLGLFVGEWVLRRRWGQR